MHNTYFFLRLLAGQLHALLSGAKVIDCYSQNKDELCLELELSQGRSFYIRAMLTASITALTFPERLHRAKSNSINLFGHIIGASIVGVEVVNYDRSLYFKLHDGSVLLFKMHGSRANVALLMNDEVKEIFKHNLAKDWQLSLKTLGKQLPQSEEEFLSIMQSKTLQQAFPIFDKDIWQMIQQLSVDISEPQTIWPVIQSILAELYSGKIYLTTHPQSQLPWISLLNSYGGQLYHSAIEAINQYARQYLPALALQQEKGQMLHLLESKLHSLQHQISALNEKLQQLTSTPDYKLMADIIMANLHLLPNDAEQADLYDFVNDRTIHVKFIKGLKPLQTAERYYKKAKNSYLQPKTLQAEIEKKQLAVKQLLEWKDDIANIIQLTELRQHPAHALIADKAKTEHAIQELGKREIFEGYTIIIGTSAPVNDALLAAAHKDDWWFHARNFAGSHVWVRPKPHEPKLPKPIIERAALLAAQHSKGKNETLCPVVFTQKKYVRKFKGAKPGEVKVEREQVIMVHL